MSLLRRREMMEGTGERIVFSGLNTSKCAAVVGFSDVQYGIRSDFVNQMDRWARIDYVILSGKKYRIEVDADIQKDSIVSTLFLNVYRQGSNWWSEQSPGSIHINYETPRHYILDVIPDDYDRNVILIGNSKGYSTGYAEFTNFVIYEI